MIPVTPRRASQTMMTGEKTMEILWVPKLWTENTRTKNAIEIGATELMVDGLATAIPPTALRKNR